MLSPGKSFFIIMARLVVAVHKVLSGLCCTLCAKQRGLSHPIPHLGVHGSRVLDRHVFLVAVSCLCHMIGLHMSKSKILVEAESYGFHFLKFKVHMLKVNRT